ncbi:MAG: hydroxyacid dehydrogenase [Faecalispora sporosphaeroides]|uniref:hydroxyacid dehydrogenase n=2 Tax=Faecalispora TaxID=3115229 RepID=UPI003992A4C6
MVQFILGKADEGEMKFVMTKAVSPEGMELLVGKAEVYTANHPDPNEYLDQMQNADALLVRVGKCDRHVIENSPQLKVIGRTGVGYDNVDVKTATAHGIPVIITPGANNRSVAEHAIAMMFSLSKNLMEAHREMCAGNWEIRDAQKSFELEGKTVGILGLGAIGREMAKLCQGCGMKVAGYDPFLSREKIESLGVLYFSDYEELLKTSDLVTIHIPLTEQTRNLIAKEQLASMKKTSLIINCGRGGIINEEDLVEALKSGTIAGAGIDVFTTEPPTPDNPLFQAPNLILSPHAAALSRESVIRMAQMCVKGCLAVCHGEKWKYVADPSVYDHPVWQGKEWASEQ